MGAIWEHILTNWQFYVSLTFAIILAFVAPYYSRKYYDRKRPLIQLKDEIKRKRNVLKEIKKLININQLNTYPEKYSRKQGEINSHWLKSVLGVVLVILYGGGVELLYPLQITKLEALNNMFSATAMLTFILFGMTQALMAYIKALPLEKAKKRQPHYDKLYKAKVIEEEEKEAQEALDEFDRNQFGMTLDGAIHYLEKERIKI